MKGLSFEVSIQKPIEVEIEVLRNNDITKPYHVVRPLSFDLDHSEQDITLSVVSTKSWSLVLPTWVTAEQLSGVGSADIVLHVAANEGDARQGVVVVADEDKQQEVEVKQGKKEQVVEVLPKSFDLDNGSNECTLSISTKAEWSLQGLPFWITADKTSGEGNAVVTLYVDKSLDKEDRAVNLRVVADGESESVEVKQDAMTYLRKLVLELNGTTTDLSVTYQVLNVYTNAQIARRTFTISAGATSAEKDFTQELADNQRIGNIVLVAGLKSAIVSATFEGGYFRNGYETSWAWGANTISRIIVNGTLEMMGNVAQTWESCPLTYFYADKMQLSQVSSITMLNSRNITNEEYIKISGIDRNESITSLPALSFPFRYIDLCGETWNLANVFTASTSYGSFYGCKRIINGGFANIKVDLRVANADLDRESALLFIRGLYDFVAAGDTSVHTFTFSRATKALLTDDDIALATSKGWTIV